MNGKNVTKSPWLLHYDGSSCNGSDIEVLACTCPRFDVERFGIINTGDPMHADIFLVTGGVNTQNAPIIKQIYSQIPEPKVVVAVGICACTGGIFKECYNILGGVDTVIPVDIYVPGCAARPESIIDGVVKALKEIGYDGYFTLEADAYLATVDDKLAGIKALADSARRLADMFDAL